MPVPFRLLPRRAGALGVALTLVDVWRRIPPRQRTQLVHATRAHGPRLAARALKAARAWRAPGV